MKRTELHAILYAAIVERSVCDAHGAINLLLDYIDNKRESTTVEQYVFLCNSPIDRLRVALNEGAHMQDYTNALDSGGHPSVECTWGDLRAIYNTIGQSKTLMIGVNALLASSPPNMTYRNHKEREAYALLRKAMAECGASPK